MDILNLLIPKVKINGIEISDDKIRMIYLDKDAYGKVFLAGSSEVCLEAGTIAFGVVEDKDKLRNAFDILKKDFKPPRSFSRFAIVTVSQNGIYSEVMDFPKELDNDQLLEAISLNAESRLPVKLAECYLDWQAIDIVGDKKIVLVSLIPKKIADDYINILKEKGFELVALEPYALSIARSVAIPEDPVIFLHLTREGMTSIIYNKKAPYLSQFEFWKEATQGKSIKNIKGTREMMKSKINKLRSYFESQYGIKVKKALIMSDVFDVSSVMKDIIDDDMGVSEMETIDSFIPDKDWAPVAGAAMRSFIPRSEDTVISLLPVGTEGLYEKQREISFVKSIMVSLSAVSFFYVVAFLAAFFFISFLDENINAQLEAKSKIPLPQQYAQIESDTKELNNYFADLARIYPKGGIDYAAWLKSINKFGIQGISFTRISFNGALGEITVSGVAATRENLTTLKTQLAGSGLFKDMKFSVQNIAQKNNLPFNVKLYPK